MEHNTTGSPVEKHVMVEGKEITFIWIPDTSPDDPFIRSGFVPSVAGLAPFHAESIGAARDIIFEALVHHDSY